jgi:hypothetical protein
MSCNIQEYGFPPQFYNQNIIGFTFLGDEDYKFLLYQDKKYLPEITIFVLPHYYFLKEPKREILVNDRVGFSFTLIYDVMEGFQIALLHDSDIQPGMYCTIEFVCASISEQENHNEHIISIEEGRKLLIENNYIFDIEDFPVRVRPNWIGSVI